MSEHNGSVYPAGYIDDGYTKEGFIEGDRNFHPPLTFAYRPALSKETLYIQRKVRELGGSEHVDECEKLCARFMAKHIIEWDLKDRSGIILDIEENILLNIEPHLSGKLFRIVAGVQASSAPSEEIRQLQEELADTKN